jgi:hypothetical protein
MAQRTGASFDPETLALLRTVLIEAEQSLPVQARTSETRVQLASGILAAARGGERDPVRLRTAALRGMDRRLASRPSLLD